MNREQALEELEALESQTSSLRTHQKADTILLKLLDSLGCEDVSRKYCELHNTKIFKY